MRRSLLMLTLLSACVTAMAAFGVSDKAVEAAGSNGEARIEKLRTESVGMLQNGPEVGAARRASESLARTMIAQASASVEDAKGTVGKKAQGKKKTRKDDGPAVPGAIVALIFGVFGILVVARRRLR